MTKKTDKTMEEKVENKQSKKESQVVTKESFFAVCAVFALLAFLIACTRQWIFGEIGSAMQGFLLGVFGYMAYPILLGIAYLTTMALLEKRMVKNRKAGWSIGLAILSLSLLIHTATTYSMAMEGYISACFQRGTSFATATVCGWLGACIISLFATLTTKVGAIVVFAVATCIFIYTSYLFVRKTVSLRNPFVKETKEKKEESAEIPLTVPTATQVVKQPTVQTPIEVSVPKAEPQNAPVQPTYAYGYDTVETPQRPAVSIEEGQESQGTSFSPFGVSNPQRGAEISDYERSREFLFGSTPQEIYQKNLIFDPNAEVNKRPNYNPNASVQSGYVPSYTDAYQSAMNENNAKPMKIFADNANQDEDKKFEEQPSVLHAIDETPMQTQEPAPYPTFETVETQEGVNEYVEEPVRDREDTSILQEESKEVERDEDYRRHDYMNLFSPSNPNIFGNSEEDRRLADDTFSRDRNVVEETRDDFLGDMRRGAREESFEDRSERDGLRLFDDVEEEKDEEDIYTLRDTYEDRGRAESIDLPTTRENTFEERTPLDVPTETPKAEKVEEKKPDPIPPKPRVIRPYVRASIDDIDCRDVEPLQDEDEIEETKATIIATLEDYKISGCMIASVTCGPTVTRYNVAFPRNIPPKKIVALDEPIGISLHSSGINVYPNFDDGVVSIEVPNKERQFVNVGCMLTGNTYVNAKPSSLMFTMGKDIGNRKVYGDISKMTHLLVAGSSGSGKSVFLGSLIISLIYKYSPEELRLILIDPKKTEFVLYNNLPHLMINEILTDAKKAVQSLNWAIGEMNRRYSLFEQMSRSGTYVVNLDQYNEHVKKEERLPKIVIIIDELADLMLAAKKDVEDRIQNLTQKARASGIHLVVATQRPSTDVITGVIKSNLNTRIAFAVNSEVDSRVILDQGGAQNLLGKGDFLYTMQGMKTPGRVQSAFISTEDSQRLVNFIKANNEAYYDESATAYINNPQSSSKSDDMSSGEIDPVYIDALRYVINSNTASISLIQRKCSVGFNKAGKIIDWMEELHYISSFDGPTARKVLITREEFESMYGPL